ncbi:arylesterase [Croceicoccus pelagius]|uniref:Arylesterase n=1 Tax=Croceicoccus pelagius TaxID=1703341 RepID=A0A917DM02_9SPHN|nr:arylesterase [Croceicoccus pelagius]GGD50066.1 arylesterase [Croceicoccus pelagius]
MRKLIAAFAALALSACGQAEGNKADGGTAEADTPVGQPTMVLAFGDSLFAGYNLPRSAAYPEQLEQALRQRGMNVRVQNAGVSGDTTSAGRQRLSFVLDSMTVKPDLALVELGANDMLRGLPPKQARENLDAIMAELDRRDIDIVVMGMKAAPNLGGEYAGEFNAIFPDLADKYDAEIVPFFIEPLIFNRSLVQSDQIHPTADGVKAMVEESVDTIEDALD